MWFIFVLTHVVSYRKLFSELNQLTKRVGVTHCEVCRVSKSYSNTLRKLIQLIKWFPATHNVSEHKNKPHML